MDAPKHVDSGNARHRQGPVAPTPAFKIPPEWISAFDDWMNGPRPHMQERRSQVKHWLEERGAQLAIQLDESGWRDLLRWMGHHELSEAPLCAGGEPPRAEVERTTPRYEVQPFEPTTVSEHFQAALADLDHPYYELAHALLGAFEQAAMGKGKERHANDLAFTEQKILQLPKQQGHVGGLIYQVAKKALESERMQPDARVRELRGVIVYAAAAITFTENGGA